MHIDVMGGGYDDRDPFEGLKVTEVGPGTAPKEPMVPLSKLKEVATKLSSSRWLDSQSIDEYAVSLLNYIQQVESNEPRSGVPCGSIDKCKSAALESKPKRRFMSVWSCDRAVNDGSPDLTQVFRERYGEYLPSWKQHPATTMVDHGDSRVWTGVNPRDFSEALQVEEACDGDTIREMVDETRTWSFTQGEGKEYLDGKVYHPDSLLVTMKGRFWVHNAMMQLADAMKDPEPEVTLVLSGKLKETTEWPVGG